MGGGVSGGSSLVGGLVLGVLGHALVPDISNIAGVTISNVVGHNLGTAVGKGNTVLAVGGIAVTGLVLLEVSLGVVVSDGIGVLVLGGLVIGGLLVGGGLVGGGGGISRAGLVGSGNSHGGKSGDDEELEHKNIIRNLKPDYV